MSSKSGSNVAPPPFFSVYDSLETLVATKSTRTGTFKLDIDHDGKQYHMDLNDVPVEELQALAKRALKIREDKKDPKGKNQEKPKEEEDKKEDKKEKRDKKDKEKEKDDEKDKKGRSSTRLNDKIAKRESTSDKTTPPSSLTASSSSGINQKDRRSSSTAASGGSLTSALTGSISAASTAGGATKVFGTPLAVVMENQKTTHPELKVPAFVSYAIMHLLHRGLAQEGLFRLSGTQGVISELKQKIDAGEEVKFTAVDDMHNVTGLLKAYLRELPQPLLSSEYFQEILNVADFPPELHAVQLRKIAQHLPKHNQNLLVELAWFMNIVAKNSEYNKMGLDNLGRVLGPNILWHPESTSDLHKMQVESDRINMMTTILLQNWRVIFEGLASPAAENNDLVLITKFHTGHKKSVQFVAQCNPPYGRHIWTGDSSGLIRIHDAVTMSTVKELTPGKGIVFCMLPLGNVMWVACERALLIFNSETQQMLKEDPIACFSIVHQRDKDLVWVSFLEGVRAYKREAFEQAVSFNTTTEVKILCVVNNRLWVGGNKSLSIWDIETHQLVKEQKLHTRKINAITELEGGKVLTASDDMKVILWDAESMECVKQLDGHTGKVISLLAPKFTDQVYSSSWDCVLKVWTRSMEPVRELRNVHFDAISSIQPLWNSTDNCWHLLTSSWDKFICVWRPKVQRPPELPPIASLPPPPTPGEPGVIPPSPSSSSVPAPVPADPTATAPKRPLSQLGVLAPPPSLALPPGTPPTGSRTPSPGGSSGTSAAASGAPAVGRVASGNVPLPPPSNLPKVAAVNPSPPPAVLPPMPGQE